MNKNLENVNCVTILPSFFSSAFEEFSAIADKPDQHSSLFSLCLFLSSLGLGQCSICGKLTLSPIQQTQREVNTERLKHTHRHIRYTGTQTKHRYR